MCQHYFDVENWTASLKFEAFQDSYTRPRFLFFITLYLSHVSECDNIIKCLAYVGKYSLGIGASGGQCHHTGGISGSFRQQEHSPRLFRKPYAFLCRFLDQYCGQSIFQIKQIVQQKTGEAKNSEVTYGGASLLGMAGATAGALLEDSVNLILYANTQRRMQ